MKFLVAFAAFLFVLSFNLKSVADDSHKTDTVTCSKDAGQDCASENHDNHGANHGVKTGYGANVDWSHKRQEQASAIFPEKQNDPTKRVVPTKVKLESPKFLAKVPAGNVKLEWAAANGAKKYHVQVSKDAGFNNRSMFIAEDKFVAGTTFEVNGLEAGVKYFWRVAAVNGDQESEYTKSVFSFSEFEAK